MKSTLTQQRGATLLVSLILLVLITLMAVTAFNLGKGSLQIVGNMQQRNQAMSAAQGAVEQVISSTQFTTTPADAIPQPCNKVPNTTCVSVNGSSTTDVKVAVTPTCKSVQVIPVAALDFSNPNDAGCLTGADQNFGVAGAATNNSMCANTLWDVQAVAADVVSNAQYTVNQGVAVRVPATATCP